MQKGTATLALQESGRVLAKLVFWDTSYQSGLGSRVALGPTCSYSSRNTRASRLCSHDVTPLEYPRFRHQIASFTTQMIRPSSGYCDLGIKPRTKEIVGALPFFFNGCSLRGLSSSTRAPRNPPVSNILFFVFLDQSRQ